MWIDIPLSRSETPPRWRNIPKDIETMERNTPARTNTPSRTNMATKTPVRISTRQCGRPDVRLSRSRCQQLLWNTGHCKDLEGSNSLTQIPLIGEDRSVSTRNITNNIVSNINIFNSNMIIETCTRLLSSSEQRLSVEVSVSSITNGS